MIAGKMLYFFSAAAELRNFICFALILGGYSTGVSPSSIADEGGTAMTTRSLMSLSSVLEKQIGFFVCPSWTRVAVLGTTRGLWNYRSTAMAYFNGCCKLII